MMSRIRQLHLRIARLESRTFSLERVFDPQVIKDLNHTIGSDLEIVESSAKGLDEYFIVKGRGTRYGDYAIVAIFAGDQGVYMFGGEREVRLEYMDLLRRPR